MISPPIPRYTRASLRQVGVSSLTPLLVNRWWYTWQVDRLDETLGPGVDTHTHTHTRTPTHMPQNRNLHTVYCAFVVSDTMGIYNLL